MSLHHDPSAFADGLGVQWNIRVHLNLQFVDAIITACNGFIVVSFIDMISKNNSHAQYQTNGLTSVLVGTANETFAVGADFALLSIDFRRNDVIQRKT